MPIQALIRGAAFPEIGQLRKGDVKPEGGKSPGKDLNYFRFTADDPEAVAQFEAAFGKEPRAIGVFLPFPSLDENFEAWCEEYTAGAIQHRCDGVTCVGWRNERGQWDTTPKPCPGGCRASGRLKVFIPAFKRMAFVTVLTTSKHDIINLHSSLAALQAVKGDLQGIPLVLRRVEREISVPEIVDRKPTGKRVRRKKWLLQIEAEPQWAAMQFGVMREAALLTSGREPLMLISGDDDDDQPEADTVEAIPVGVILEAAKAAGCSTPLKVKEKLAPLGITINASGVATMRASLEALKAGDRARALEAFQSAVNDQAQAEAAPIEGVLV